MQTRIRNSLACLVLLLLAGCPGGDATTSELEAGITLSIEPAITEMYVGEVKTLVAVRSENLAFGKRVPATWNSASPQVANVLPVGDSAAVTGVSPGEAVITAVATNIGFASAFVRVKGLRTITAMPNPVQMKVGQTVQLGLTLREADGTVIPSAPFTFESSATAVATVTPQGGLITGVTVGTATITIRSKNSTSLDVPVTVTNAGLVLSIDPVGLTLEAGKGGVLVCEARNEVTNQPVSGVVLLWSTSDPSVATVSTTGAVTGVNEGTATITCNAPGASAPVAATVTVKDPPLTLTAVPESITLRVGESAELKVLMRNHRNEPVVDRQTAFVSQNTAIASVRAGDVEHTSVVTGVAAGNTVIHIESIGRGASAIEVPVTVTDDTDACIGDEERDFDVSVTSDPSGHKPFINMPSKIRGKTKRSGTNRKTITVTAASPFVEVTGTIDPATCAISLAGMGTVAGFNNVRVEMTGTAPGSGPLEITYSMGTNGALPGGNPITYLLRSQ